MIKILITSTLILLTAYTDLGNIGVEQYTECGHNQEVFIRDLTDIKNGLGFVGYGIRVSNNFNDVKR